MFTGFRTFFTTAFLALAMVVASLGVAGANGNDGVVRVRSAHGMAETVALLKKDIATKGIMFFGEIDQSKLAADAGIKDRGPQFKMASEVIASITSAVKAK